MNRPAATQAFVLGAGLGTRLRPLTDHLPKPLIPVWHRPLVAHAFDHLRTAGAGEFIVNTHWQPAAWDTAFPGGLHDGCPVTLRHEPVLLETGGGLANIADLIRPESGPFWVYNGDILCTSPLAAAWQAHQKSGALVTLVLRSTGPVCNIAFDAPSGRVLDLRSTFGRPGTHQFTGIYLVEPDFLPWLGPVEVKSVVPAFLDVISRENRLGGVVIDDGLWLDLGDRASYLEAHRLYHCPADTSPVAPDARVAPDAVLTGSCAAGPGAEIGAGSVLEDTLVWPGGIVSPGARLTRCVVRTGQTATGSLTDADV